MKKNLGSIFVFILSSCLYGSNLCDYNISIKNKTPYLKEPVEIDFNAVQIDKTHVMFFKIAPKKSDKYEIYSVDEKNLKKTFHQNKIKNKFILYPLKSGDIDVKFDFKVSEATDEDVEKSYTGGYEIINALVTKDTKIDIKPFHIHVKPIKKDTDLVGDFSIQMKLDKKRVQEYQQLNLTYTIRGLGRIDINRSILPKIKNVNSFMEISSNKNSNNPSINNTKIYHYALLSEHNFTIPSIKLKCFSIKNHNYYTLKTEEAKVVVEKLDKKELVDRKNNYPTKSFDFQALLPYINAFLLIMLGFVLGKIDLFKYFKYLKRKNPFYESVKQTKNERELLKLLLSKRDVKFQKFIIMLEKSIYENQKCDINKIKDELLK